MIKFYRADPIEIDNTIESTYIKHDNSNQECLDLMAQLENERFQNKKLLSELESTKQQLEGFKKFNHKLEQDVQYHKIQVNNLKNINIKFIRTINNLQSYRGFVAQLLAKKSRCTKRIQRLVKELKNMQNIIRKKNEIIHQKTRAYEIAKLQAAHIIKESYGI